jgi:hypothetical protein
MAVPHSLGGSEGKGETIDMRARLLIVIVVVLLRYAGQWQVPRAAVIGRRQ